MKTLVDIDEEALKKAMSLSGAPTKKQPSSWPWKNYSSQGFANS